MLEYPKMLYNTTGGKAVVKSEADEKIWRKDGYMAFAELSDEADRDAIIKELEALGEEADKRSSTKTLANKLAKLKDETK